MSEELKLADALGERCGDQWREDDQRGLVGKEIK